MINKRQTTEIEPTMLKYSPVHSLKRESYVVKKKTMMTKFKKPRKTIRFADKTEECTNIAPFVSSNELKERWYNKAELANFKQNAVQLAIYSLNQFGVDALPRGMESCTRERLKHKRNTIYFVVVAHKKGKGSEYTAGLLGSLSAWNKELAFNVACRDYFELYQPAMVEQIPPVNSSPPKIPLMKKKPTQTAQGRLSPDILEAQEEYRNRLVQRKNMCTAAPALLI